MSTSLGKQLREHWAGCPRTVMKRCFMTGKQCIFPHAHEPALCGHEPGGEQNDVASSKAPTGFDLRLMSWGDGSGAPTSGKNLVVVGTDNNGLLHIRIFDATGNRIKDTVETQLPAQAAAITTLKQQLLGLLSPHVLTDAEKAQVIAKATSIVGQTPPTLFVVMPFSPNLDMFYRWSLKPFLMEAFGVPESHVQRADEVRDIGYIICEKICRKIQEADLIIAEMSIPNPNVLYEVGLAYGLQRPLVFLQDENCDPKFLNDRCVRQCLDLPSNPREPSRVISYPGLSQLRACGDVFGDVLERRPKETAADAKLPPPVERRLKIVLLKVEGHHAPAKKETDSRDIYISISEIVAGAVRVAMNEIKDGIMNGIAGDPGDRLVEFVRRLESKDWQDFATVKTVTVDGRGNFAEVAHAVDTSFCTIIDVTGNNSLACFWLGYCHARGLNAVPIARKSDRNGVRLNAPSAPDETLLVPRNVQSLPSAAQGGVGILAFDIRALWYAEYDDEHEPHKFKDKVKEILEHLLARDLPDREKSRFWDRLPSNRKIKIFTGSFHHEELNREMVGDWDVRTVSELFSYLPSLREAADVELVEPIYSPEVAFSRTRPKFDLRLMSSLNDVNGIPTEGKGLIIVALVNNVLHLRIFDGDGRMIVDTDEQRLTEQARQIEDLRKQLESLWPPHELTRSDKGQVTTAVTSIVDPTYKSTRTDFIDRFRQHIEKLLNNANAIVIASPETNPITEYLLHRIYQIDTNNPGRLAFETKLDDKPEFTGYIVVKKKKKGDPVEPREFERLFYFENAEGEVYTRGFAKHVGKTKEDDETLMEPYFSQDDATREFYVLGQLVVAKNPLHEAGIVIILNGISGPATFALAEVITGGVSSSKPGKYSKSEEILGEINQRLDDPNCVGVETIIRVTIKPGHDSSSSDRNLTDIRKVVSWDIQQDTHQWPVLRKIMKVEPMQQKSRAAVGQPAGREVAAAVTQIV